jgi:glucose-1-phosphate thymidylyltransferase
VRRKKVVKKARKSRHEVIGLVPAGGQAKRISPLPCSKELYPLGFWSVDKGSSSRPKVACHYLLEKMQFAGISKAFIVLRCGKWDIPAYLKDGNMLNMHLAYLIMGVPYGVPYTLDQAYPYLQNATVAFGFPDILFRNENAFLQLLTRQAETKADIVLGLFPTDRTEKKDMIDVDETGHVRLLAVGPSHTDLRYTWCIAVWSAVFTRHMHDFIAECLKKYRWKERELTVGEVIQSALHSGLHIVGETFPDDRCLDIGTPDDLVKAVRSFGSLHNYT